MTLFNYTEADRLRVLDRMIANAKQSYRAGAGVEDEQFHVLRALAADIRARLPGAAEPTLVALENRVQRVKESAITRAAPAGVSERVSYDRDALRAAGFDLVANWSVIRAGLIELSMGAARR